MLRGIEKVVHYNNFKTWGTTWCIDRQNNIRSLVIEPLFGSPLVGNEHMQHPLTTLIMAIPHHKFSQSINILNASN